jgi:hypothetical protein
MAWVQRDRKFTGQDRTMQMNQIRYFLALCEEKSFTLAAKRSGVSQPSLTNAIGTLERELGGRLFRRRPAVALTALGRAIAPYLQQIADAADQACETARSLLGPAISEVAPLQQKAPTFCLSLLPAHSGTPMGHNTGYGWFLKGQFVPDIGGTGRDTPYSESRQSRRHVGIVATAVWVPCESQAKPRPPESPGVPEDGRGFFGAGAAAVG